MSKYDDIINLPHPEPKNHKRMSLVSRAAQFGAFRALVGHEDAVNETARVTDKRIDLDEYEIEKINETITRIAEDIKEEPEIKIVYFVPDEKKSGGMYIKENGAVKKVDAYNQKLVMVDDNEIFFDRILEVEYE